MVRQVKKHKIRPFRSLGFFFSRIFATPVKYSKLVWHIFSRLQPWFSILVALAISLPLVYAADQIINLSNSQTTVTHTYREGVLGNFTNIDPLPLIPTDKQLSQLNRDVTRLLLDPLFSTSSDGNLIGMIADTYTIQEGGAKFIITLKDRNWSDGTQITIDDVLATFQNIKNIGENSLYFSSLDGVTLTKVDDRTMLFSLDVANSAFLESLSWPILPAKYAVLNYDNLLISSFGKNPISSTGWLIENINTTYVKLNNASLVKSIEFVFYNTYADLDKALNAGLIDGYYSLDKISDKQFSSVSEYPLVRQLYSLYFNVAASGSVLTDPNIRKAISYGINRNEVVGDLGVSRQSIISDNSWAFNPSVNTYAYVIQKAGQLLDNAGYKLDNNNMREINGKVIQFTLSVPDTNTKIRLAKKIQSDLKQIGIKVDIKAIKDSEVVDNERKSNIFYNTIVLTKNFEAMIFAVDSGLDPDKFSQWHSSRIPKVDTSTGNVTVGLNFSGYASNRVDQFLFLGRKESDKDKRKTPYFQFQKVFYEDAPVYTLYNPYLFYVKSDRIQNVDFSGAIKIEDRFINFDKWRLG